MRNSKFLKGLCYVLIPILLLVLCLSIFYGIDKNDYEYYNENLNYFETDEFLANYMSILSSRSYDLIYRNDSFNSIMDTESNIKICYRPSESYYYYNQIENYYYLIIYKNLALTNIELTTNTNSIEKLKNYIQNLDAKKANIINGNVQADSEIIETKALQYFDNFKNEYYSIIENETTATYEEVEEVLEETYTTSSQQVEPSIQKEYYTSTIEDFQIYTSYEEKLMQRNDIMFYKKLIDMLAPYENISIPAIPVCSVLLLIMAVYLIISIGHSKNKEEIDLNDFDKLPLEIVLGVFIIIICIFVAILSEFSYTNYSDEALNYFNLFVSGLITIYFITYISFMLLLVTTVKRIKAKTLISSSICGRLLKLCIRIIKRFCNKLKEIFNGITENWNISAKITILTIVFILVLILMVGMFTILGVLIDMFLIAFVLYKVVERINCYKKIEEHLKDMYEGKEVESLIVSDFTPEFKDIVKYINDVSNGFENAKQEGIKSERMKTELITNVSHDIKTPLTSIINYVDLLKKEDIKNKKAQEYIEVLDGKSQRLKKLTEDLVEASKASSGAVKLNIEKINIVELIKQTTGEFEDRFKDKKLEIVSSMPKEDIYINADSRYMYRIIENLFSNISKYALDSSRVYIDVKSNGLKVKISIKNISKDKLNISAEELMQRFVRGDKSRTTEGSGLGLSISQSLTELQKGTFALNVDGDLFKVELEFDIVK